FARISAPPPRPPASDPLAQGLFDIRQADRSFETDNFLSLARSTYEKIVTAFAAGDRAVLRPLLSDEVYGVFDGAIAARETRKEKTAFTFVGFRDAKIVHAEMRGQTAEITLSFDGQFISATSNEAGAVIEGDPQTARETTDVWSFGREGGASNWLLVATSGGLP
ncbi:MAG TPA: Tim44/TimA family putative adaptor protein, partial [Rhizomicrobium sp.]